MENINFEVLNAADEQALAEYSAMIMDRTNRQ
jgi:hypothetical protein